MIYHIFNPEINSIFIPEIGLVEFTPFSIDHDLQEIYSWVVQPYAKYWGMQRLSFSEVKREYQQLSTFSQIYLGSVNKRNIFLIEVYNPENQEVGDHYVVDPGDCGMHILVAPLDPLLDTPIRGFTWGAFKSVMQFLFSDKNVNRILVEPDSNNKKIHALNQRAGFELQKYIQLKDKHARLEFCTRTQFECALKEDKNRMNQQETKETGLSVSHLTPDLWEKANRLLVRKALSELSHERLLFPQLVMEKGSNNGFQQYEVVLGKSNRDEREDAHLANTMEKQAIVYRFKSKVLALNHWAIDLDSISKVVNNLSVKLDAVQFFIEFQHVLGISNDLLPAYLEEICNTLYGSAFKLSRDLSNVENLLEADFQTLEAAMKEGHPCFLANNGRIGFNVEDYQAFAPESAQTTQLLWLAITKKHSVFSTSDDLDYDTLISTELSSSTYTTFKHKIEQNGGEVSKYYFIPVHPWQWNNKLAYLFATDIANRDIVFLGSADDAYQPQQSIRTFFNKDNPNKRYVKTALSILNMGFMRGLSPYYMSTTPAINDWINKLIQQDPYLSATGFSILREVAAVGYKSPMLESATDQQSPYRKMLSALWRESPLPNISSGESLMTMAGLLHVDGNGRALLSAKIAASGISTDAWLDAYLRAYLTPLLHCFYAYDLVFMPHGENIILVFDQHVPVRAIMKDIAEECAILNKDLVLSANVQRLTVDVPDDLKVLSLLTDVFDCFFRFLSAILDDQGNYDESQFWGRVASCVLDYQRDHPELEDKFRTYDLFAEEFTLSCLNRLQLANNRQMIDLADPAKNLKFEGTLVNPIAKYRPNTSQSETVSGTNRLEEPSEEVTIAEI